MHRIHEDFSESLAGFGCHRVRATLLRLLIPQLPGTDSRSWPFFLFFDVVISSLFLPFPSSSSSSLQRILLPPGFCKEIVITSSFFFTMLGDDYCALTVSLCCVSRLSVSSFPYLRFFFLNSFAGITNSSAISFSALWKKFRAEEARASCHFSVV